MAAIDGGLSTREAARNRDRNRENMNATILTQYSENGIMTLPINMMMIDAEGIPHLVIMPEGSGDIHVMENAWRGVPPTVN